MRVEGFPTITHLHLSTVSYYIFLYANVGKTVAKSIALRDLSSFTVAYFTISSLNKQSRKYDPIILPGVFPDPMNDQPDLGIDPASAAIAAACYLADPPPPCPG